MDNTKSSGTCNGLCCTKIKSLGVIIGKNKVLEDVNLHIHCGELTSIIGPNGAGKSTLLKAILGEVKHSGELHFLDSCGGIGREPVIGYVPQQMSFDTTTPVSVLDLFAACRAGFPAWLGVSKRFRERVLSVLQKVSAEHLLDRRLGALSGGELQRVLLALALDPVPDLLLLDEPVSGIDQKGLELFYNTVSQLRRNYDLSIILVSHDLDMVFQYSDRIVLLNGTVIRCGSPDEVLNDSNAAKLFGMSWYKNIESRGHR